MKTFLITGAAGFVGGHLTRRLLRRCNSQDLGTSQDLGADNDIRLRLLVRKQEQAAALQGLGVEVVVGDLTNPQSLREAVDGVWGVYHIAAEFRRVGISDAEYISVNVEGTKNLLDASIECGVKRFIHCSTVGVLGHVQNPPADETHPYRPGDIYQESKVAGEKLVLDYFRSGRMKGVILRPGMIWGPGDTRTLKLFKSIATRRFVYVGKGHALVHFVDVRDLACAFEMAMNREDLDKEVFIIAGQKSVPLYEMVSLITRECGVPEPKIHVPLRPVWLCGAVCELMCRPFGIEPPIFRRRVDFFTKDRSFNTDKSKSVLGFQAAQSLEQEIADIVAWYQAFGWIPAPRMGLNWQVDPSFMVRDINGNIREWGGASERFYGFDSLKACGAVSHQLLKTTFPEPIEKINNALLTKKRWDGLLTHRRKDGSEVQVQSSWRLVPDVMTDVPIVFELNWPYSAGNYSGNPPKSKHQKLHGFVSGTLLSGRGEGFSILEPFLALPI